MDIQKHRGKPRDQSVLILLVFYVYMLLIPFSKCILFLQCSMFLPLPSPHALACPEHVAELLPLVLL